MKKYPKLFHTLSTELRKAKVLHVLIGGFAVNAYGYGRATHDFDLLMTDEGFAQAYPVLEKIGYQILKHEKLCVRLQHKNENLDPGFLDIDVVFVDKHTFDEIWKTGIETEMLGTKFVVPSLEHLIALKLHALNNNPRRTQDFVDIGELVKENGIDIKSNRFRDLCLKYATKEWYNFFLKILGK